MRRRSLATTLLLLALPSFLAACPSEPAGDVVAPPQPSVTPTANANAAPTASVSAPAAAARPAFENPGGMWMPEQMPLHAATLKSLGLELDPAALSRLDTAPLGAVVSLGGCTASFVGPDGLAITNFHCVSRWLAQASTPSKDLQADGVMAKTRAEEVWAGASSRVFVTRSIRDVTAEVRDGIDAIKSDTERLRAVEAHTKKLLAACEKDRPEVRCNVASFFGGGAFRLIEQIEMKDVRLVFTPPAGMGRFGGEIDNWRWPRQSADFAFLRVYVGKDGKPADHGADNVPYKPAFYLPFASSPLRAGDLAIVAGFPGSTSRLKIAAEVDEASSLSLPARIDSYKTFVALFESFGAKSKDLQIKTSPMVQGLNNGLTKTRGIVEALSKGNLLDERRQTEAELLKFIDADPARKAAYGGVVEQLRARIEERKAHRERDALLRDIFGMPRLFGTAVTIARMAEERKKPDAERLPAFQERNYRRYTDETTGLQKQYDREVEAAAMNLAIERFRPIDFKERPGWLNGQFLLKVEDLDRKKRILALYEKTKLEDVETRKKLMTTAKLEDLKKMKDPLMDLALQALADEHEMRERDDAFTGALLVLAPKYAEALRAFVKSKGKPDLAPDANGTLRLTYGTVRGYKPRPDAPVYTPFSTLAELLKKNTGKEPFNAPQALADAAQSKKDGYVFADVGDVPVNFLTDLDITGGNSGSPTLNAKGELIGLAFDGTYEGVASDWVFMPESARTIHVDARYILWVLDAVFGDAELLKELKRPAKYAH